MRGAAAGLCRVELETVRRKWEASVQRAGLGCRCWRLMWVWPWLVFGVGGKPEKGRAADLVSEEEKMSGQVLRFLVSKGEGPIGRL
jgi:hypothetical protein